MADEGNMAMTDELCEREEKLMRSLRALATIVVALGASIALSVPAAQADPINSPGIFVVQFDACDNGQSYTVAVHGHSGRFNPGHDVNSNLMFIPYAFGEFTITATDAAGNVEVITIPPEVKGSGNIPDDAVTCTFHHEWTADGIDYVAHGSVTVNIVGSA
jgi:hypothetical protein